MGYQLIYSRYFCRNNYAFLPKTCIAGLPKLYAESTPEIEFTSTKSKFKSAFAEMFIQGPAFFVPYKDHRFGMFVNARAMLSANRIHNALPDLAMNFISGDGNLDTNRFAIPGFRINTMAWSEYGLVYGYNFRNQSNEHLHFGTSVKYLHGFLSGFTNNNIAEFSPTDSSDLFFINLSNQYGYVDPTTLGENNKSGLGKYINGKGVGVDLGFSYEKKRSRKGFFLRHTKQFKDKYKKLVDYHWKIGVSLLDVGWVNFKNTKRYLLEVNNANVPQADSGQLTSPADIDDYISTSLY